MQLAARDDPDAEELPIRDHPTPILERDDRIDGYLIDARGFPLPWLEGERAIHRLIPPEAWNARIPIIPSPPRSGPYRNIPHGNPPNVRQVEGDVSRLALHERDILRQAEV